MPKMIEAPPSRRGASLLSAGAMWCCSGVKTGRVDGSRQAIYNVALGVCCQGGGPLIQDACTPSDRQSDARPMLHGLGENFPRLFEIIARVKQPIDFLAILGPLFDLVEVAIVRVQQIAGFFIGPIGYALTCHNRTCYPAAPSRDARGLQMTQFDTVLASYRQRLKRMHDLLEPIEAARITTESNDGLGQVDTTRAGIDAIERQLAEMDRFIALYEHRTPNKD